MVQGAVTPRERARERTTVGSLVLERACWKDGPSRGKAMAHLWEQARGCAWEEESA